MGNHNIVIRTYQKKDCLQVQNICIVTGLKQALQDEEMQNMLLTSYCNYYIDREPGNCFVAMDGETVAGYILCAENAVGFAEAFQKHYMQNNAITDTPLKYREEYPAHLHIDILPDYQRMGIGFMLMDALIAHLKGKAISGLMLCVSSDNTKGISFYEKYGFTVLERREIDIVMGMPLK